MQFSKLENQKEYTNNQAINARVARELLVQGRDDEAWEVVRSDISNNATKQRWLESTRAFIKEEKVRTFSHWESVNNED